MLAHTRESDLLIAKRLLHNNIFRRKSQLIWLLCCLFIFSQAAGQGGTITGRITDDKGGALAFVNVSLLKAADSSLAAGAVTDKEGKFSLVRLTPGHYLLRFTAIGYAPHTLPAFDVRDPAFTRDFGTIALKPDVQALKEVSVTALRPSIVQMADRLVVSVEGTAMAAGNSAFAVLARAPGVFIDPEGNIQLNGRSGVTIMLDGKLTYLSARDLRTMLESMSAENIKNIEIITNPSAKYDAEGTSGILNINLKKNTRQGINGSVFISEAYNFYGQHSYSAGGNLNVKSGRWNAFLMSDFNHREGGRNGVFTRVFYGTNTTYFDQTATGNFRVEGPPSVRLGADYSLNDRHTIGFMGYYNTNTLRADFLTETLIGDAPKKPSQFIDADNFNSNTFSNFTGNLHYTGKLDTLGTTLSADFDYVRIQNRGEAFLNNYYRDLSSGQQTQDLLYNNTPNKFDIYSLRIDFSKPLKQGRKLELGGRASSIDSDNDFSFYFNNGVRVPDPSRTNYFIYREKIYAGYANWSGPVSSKLTLQAGLRLEHTASLGNSITTGQRTPRNYTNLFPSVFLQQKVSNNYGLNYSYSRRLNRPNYGSLNPFRAYRDPYTWYEGNTALRPQYTHSFSIAQVIRQRYNITLSYQLQKDVISEIPLLYVDDTLTVYTTGNVNDGQSIGMTGIAPVKISKKWDSQNTLVLSYNKFSFVSNNGKLENEQLFFLIQSNHTILLPKELRLEVNLMYRGPAASGLYRIASMHRTDLGLKRSFFNKKLDVTLNANDIFKGFRYLWTTDINGNVNDFNQYFRLRSIGLTLRYNFSKGQKVNVKQRTAIEELNRT
ncbi:MAG TPA: TonB-dependent receptor [Flavisolibacter sp.]|nr:TonB-dependent receptor [Flavisolibacter sp.]